MRTIRLITCNDAMKAHILQGALENEGIESVLHNENFSFLYVGLVSNISGVDIFVSEEDYKRAVEVLKQNQSWPEELTLCPYCGSSSIKFRRRKGHLSRIISTAIISIISGTPPGNNHWEYVCKDCHQTFETPVSKFPPSEENND